MNSAIHIGNNFGEKSLEDAATAIERVFDSAHRNHMDQDTVRQALGTLQHIGCKTAPVHISNCHFESIPEAAVKIDGGLDVRDFGARPDAEDGE